jgi:hypothetical protein
MACPWQRWGCQPGTNLTDMPNLSHALEPEEFLLRNQFLAESVSKAQCSSAKPSAFEAACEEAEGCSRTGREAIVPVSSQVKNSNSDMLRLRAWNPTPTPLATPLDNNAPNNTRLAPPRPFARIKKAQSLLEP